MLRVRRCRAVRCRCFTPGQIHHTFENEIPFIMHIFQTSSHSHLFITRVTFRLQFRMALLCCFMGKATLPSPARRRHLALNTIIFKCMALRYCKYLQSEGHLVCHLKSPPENSHIATALWSNTALWYIHVFQEEMLVHLFILFFFRILHRQPANMS